jgi:hypothetical protein
MRVVAVLFSALAVAACLAPSNLFVTSLKGGLVADDLAVTLEDRTGLVQAFGPAQPGQFNLSDGVKADANPTVLVVSWLGGLCDRATHLVFAAANGEYSVTETTEREAACRDASVRRTVSIGLSSPIDAATVTLFRRPHVPVSSPPV